jgi:hypothetical protein
MPSEIKALNPRPPSGNHQAHPAVNDRPAISRPHPQTFMTEHPPRLPAVKHEKKMPELADMPLRRAADGPSRKPQKLGDLAAVEVE